MKKKIIIGSIICLLIVCISVLLYVVLKPTNISITTIDNKVIKYGMTKNEVEQIIGMGTENESFFEYNNFVKLYYRDNTVSFIEISSIDTKTLKGIKIGDSFEKVKNLFSKGISMDNTYSVALDKKGKQMEIDGNHNNSYWINFLISDDNISKIQLYDRKYGHEMR
jgi:hypothetical protein